MAKLVIEVDLKSAPENNDVIRYNKSKGKWEVVSYQVFNNDLYKERNKLQNEIAILNKDLLDFKVKVNEKLKEYHDILQVLTH